MVLVSHFAVKNFSEKDQMTRVNPATDKRTMHEIVFRSQVAHVLLQAATKYVYICYSSFGSTAC